MKGLQHNVIEINDTQNDNIDKILVFLKPEAANVALMTTRTQATELIKELDIRKTRRMWRRPKLAAAVISTIVIIALGVILFI
ncbi:MAG: hypothetical protein IJW74_00370 [Oscillospiraceae bacterium]|nr:hypothetical protein [Oscillospiraceae bacterium]